MRQGMSKQIWRLEKRLDLIKKKVKSWVWDNFAQEIPDSIFEAAYDQELDDLEDSERFFSDKIGTFADHDPPDHDDHHDDFLPEFDFGDLIKIKEELTGVDVPPRPRVASSVPSSTFSLSPVKYEADSTIQMGYRSNDMGLTKEDLIRNCKRYKAIVKMDKLSNSYNVKDLVKKAKSKRINFKNRKHPRLNFIIDHKRKTKQVSVKCPLCGISVTKYQLKPHIAVFHKKECNFKCDDPGGCTKSFPNKYQLVSHQKLVHEISSSLHKACPICNLTVRPDTLKRHILDKHTENVEMNIPCEFCKKKFKNKRCLLYHKKLRHPELLQYRFYCNFEGCSKGFDSQRSHIAHIELHKTQNATDENRCIEVSFFICQTCGRTFKSSPRYHFHIRNKKCEVVKEKGKICQVCNKSFLTNAILKVHSRCHLPAEEKRALYISEKILCNICGTSVHKSGIKHHVKKHEGLTGIACEIDNCGKRFDTQNNLTLHYGVHLNPKRKEFSETFAETCSKELKAQIEVKRERGRRSKLRGRLNKLAAMT